MQSARDILVLRGGTLGDLLLTLPVLTALRSAFPEATITLGARTPALELIANTRLIDRALSLEGPDLRRLYVQDGLAGKSLSYDLAVSCLADPDGVVLSNLKSAGIDRIVTREPEVRQGHAVDHFLQALPEIGVPIPDKAVPHLKLDSGRIEKGRRLASALGGNPIVLHPGSGSAGKNWPLENYLALAGRLRATDRLPVFTLGEADMHLVDPVLTAGMPVIRDRHLADIAGLLAVARAYVGNDSGITHLAAALGTPTVALFGPTAPATWGPRGAHVRIVTAPCRTTEALAAIGVAEAYAALEAVITGVRSAHPTPKAAI
jgi:heptosyltransferase-2